MHGLIELLVTILVLAIVAGLVWWVLSLLPLPEPWGQIVRVCFILIILLIVLIRALPLLGVAIGAEVLLTPLVIRP